MKPLILATLLTTAATTTVQANQTYTPAPQAVLDATAGEAGMQRVLPLTMLAGLTVLFVLAGNR